MKDPKTTSEFWIAILTVLANLGFAFASQNKWGAVFAACAIATIGGVYGYFRTDLPSANPGWKTKLFWGSIAVIVGSAALNLAEAKIPGLSPSVTKYASMIATIIVAAGYTLVRAGTKQTEMLFAKKQDATK
jgi:uncharacterized membrane protein YhhN